MDELQIYHRFLKLMLMHVDWLLTHYAEDCYYDCLVGGHPQNAVTTRFDNLEEVQVGLEEDHFEVVIQYPFGKDLAEAQDGAFVIQMAFMQDYQALMSSSKGRAGFSQQRKRVLLFILFILTVYGPLMISILSSSITTFAYCECVLNILVVLDLDQLGEDLQVEIAGWFHSGRMGLLLSQRQDELQGIVGLLLILTPFHIILGKVVQVEQHFVDYLAGQICVYYGSPEFDRGILTGLQLPLPPSLQTSANSTFKCKNSINRQSKIIF